MTKESLRQFAKNNHVEQKVEDFIDFKNSSSLDISITAKEIAIIMGHTRVVDLLRSVESKSKFFFAVSNNNSECNNSIYEVLQQGFQ